MACRVRVERIGAGHIAYNTLGIDQGGFRPCTAAGEPQGACHAVQGPGRSRADLHPSGQTVLISEPDGQINWPSEKGLYFRDTRIVSSWAIYANGEPWQLLNGGATSYYSCRIFLTNRSLLSEDGVIPERTLGLTIGRSIAGGLHEDIDLTNHGMKRVRFQLEFALRCDFADVFEVKSGRIVRRGRITTDWSESRSEQRTTYRNADFCRALAISVARPTSRAVDANGRLSFEVVLEPGATWSIAVFSTPSRMAIKFCPRHHIA